MVSNFPILASRPSYLDLHSLATRLFIEQTERMRQRERERERVRDRKIDRKR